MKNPCLELYCTVVWSQNWENYVRYEASHQNISCKIPQIVEQLIAGFSI